MRILQTLGLSLALLLLPMAALGHSWYDYDCCSDQDCKPIDESRVAKDDKGWVVDGKFRFPEGKVRPSRDGQYHFCQNPYTGAPLCLYVPLAG